jgi:enamine deaminase RidA (YjgF/YER057c/UK114 family)
MRDILLPHLLRAEAVMFATAQTGHARWIADFERMNEGYVELMGDHRPARTVIGVRQLPKPGVLVTMNLTAVTKE